VVFFGAPSVQPLAFCFLASGSSIESVNPTDALMLLGWVVLGVLCGTVMLLGLRAARRGHDELNRRARPVPVMVQPTTRNRDARVRPPIDFCANRLTSRAPPPHIPLAPSTGLAPQPPSRSLNDDDARGSAPRSL
jgi:hypothetical protein